MKARIRIRKTPNCLHPYTATMRGQGAYGWGNTPPEARACLIERLKKIARFPLDP